jgi:hypothetical protein
VLFLVFSILLLVFTNWLLYHTRTDIAVNVATTNSVSCKPISRKILKLLSHFAVLFYHYVNRSHFLSRSFQIKMGP